VFPGFAKTFYIEDKDILGLVDPSKSDTTNNTDTDTQSSKHPTNHNHDYHCSITKITSKTPTTTTNNNNNIEPERIKRIYRKREYRKREQPDHATTRTRHRRDLSLIKTQAITRTSGRLKKPRSRVLCAVLAPGVAVNTKWGPATLIEECPDRGWNCSFPGFSGKWFVLIKDMNFGNCVG
jgi:hypothetical protein